MRNNNSSSARKKRNLGLIHLVILGLSAAIPPQSTASENTPAPEFCQPEMRLLPGLEDLPISQLSLPTCPSQDEVLLEEARKEYGQVFPRGSVTKRTVYGLLLEGTEDELRALEATLKGVRPSDWPRSASGCTTPVCALKGLLGSEELARKVLMFHKRTGYAFSLSIEANRKPGGGYLPAPWSSHEIREAHQLGKILPPELARLARLHKLLRVADGYRHGDDDANVAAYTSANFPQFEREGEIIVYDSLADANKKSSIKGSQASFTLQALLHEICHNFDFQRMYQTGSTRGYSETASWGFRDLSLAKPNRNTRTPGEPLAGYISRYAEESPAEDFAESCAAYVIAPAELKRTAPAKYALLQAKLFSGREYLDASWNQPTSLQWDELENAISAAQERCSSIHSQCLDTIVPATPPGTIVIYSLNQEDRVTQEMKKNACVAENEAALQQELLVRLSGHADYCRRGGGQALEKRAGDLCGPTRDKLKKIRDLITADRTRKAWSACGEQGDYTLDCGRQALLAQIQSELPFEPELLPLVSREIAATMDGPGNGMKALFAKHPSGEWISACLRKMNEILVFEDGSIIYFLRESGEMSRGASIPPIGSAFDSDRDMARMGGKPTTPEAACLQGLQSYFESKGLRMPPSEAAHGSYRRAMAVPEFQSEWKEFEREVLLRIHREIGLNPLFRKKKILQIVEAWVAKKPDARSALLDESFIKHLAKMDR